MTDIIHISPSQIEAWNTCPRKWGIGAIDKIRGAPSPAATLGSRVHTLLEDYLLNGTAFSTATKEGKTAEVALEHIPLPFSCIVEGKHPDGSTDLKKGRSTVLPSGGGFNWAFVIDVRIPGTIPFILDHKTTRDFKWCKSAEHLTTKDPQGLIYAWAATQFEDTIPDEIDLCWSYMRTVKPKLKQIKIRTTSLKVFQQMEEVIYPITDQIVWAKENISKGDANRLPFNTVGCAAFGGCGYAGVHCTLTIKERFKAVMSGKQSLDQLIADQSGGVVAESAAPKTVTLEEESEISGTDRKMAAQMIKKGREPGPNAKPGLVAAFAEATTQAGGEEDNGAPEPEEPPSVQEKTPEMEKAIEAATETITLPPEKKEKEPKKEKVKRGPKPKKEGFDLGALRAAVDKMEGIEEKKPHLLRSIDDIQSALAGLRSQLEEL